MKRFKPISLSLLGLVLVVSLSACGAELPADPLDRTELAIQKQQALDAYTFEGNLSVHTYKEDGQEGERDSVHIKGKCKREEGGEVQLLDVSRYDMDTGRTLHTIMRRQVPEESFPKEVDVLGWLPSFSIRDDPLDSQFHDGLGGSSYDMTVKGDRIQNALVEELCEEENLVLDEARVTYSMIDDRLSSQFVQYFFCAKSPATGQYDLLAKKIAVTVEYDRSPYGSSSSSKIEIPDLTSDVTYE